MKALHIVAYEKFLPHIIDVSEAVNPQNNQYISFNAKGETSYETAKLAVCIKQQGRFTIEDRVLESISWCDAVFLHPFDLDSFIALKFLRPETVVVWCGMGADIYSFSSPFRNHLILPHTDKVLRAASPLAKRAKNSLRYYFGNFIPGLKPKRIIRHRRAAKRIDFICFNERNLDMNLPGLRATRVSGFQYYTLEGALSMGAQAVAGNDLLIGNSATWSNNHFDIFEQLCRLDLGERRIVLPLNYGNKDYADRVEQRAHSLFGGKNVISLRNWLPVHEYNDILTRCSIVFMNHIRGQAMGNICSMLFRGAKVYLRPENPYAEFLENLGVHFHYIGDSIDKDAFTPLAQHEKSTNARIMAEHWNKHAVEERTVEIFRAVGREVERRRAERARREPVPLNHA